MGIKIPPLYSSAVRSFAGTAAQRSKAARGRRAGHYAAAGCGKCTADGGPPFRPPDNSPSRRHWTHIFLLCLMLMGTVYTLCRGFAMGCGGKIAGGVEPRPYGSVTRGAMGGRPQGSPLRVHYWWCVGEGLCPSRGRGKTPPLQRVYKKCLHAGRRGRRPLRKRIMGCVGEGLCPSRGRPQGSPLRITSKSLLRADVGIGPYGGETEIRPLSGGRGRTPPLRMRYKGCNGRTEASAPTDTFIANCQWPVA